MNEVKKLVIDRSRWLRGERHQPSKLLRAKDGKMCCLGFFGVACGVPQELLLEYAGPYSSSKDGGIWPEWCSSGRCGRLYGPNDRKDLSDAARESEIARIFAEHGVEVVFTDGEASNASAPKAPTKKEEAP